MTLRRRAYLLESAGGKVVVSMRDYPADIKDNVLDLSSQSERRARDGKETHPYTKAMARKDASDLIRATKGNMVGVAKDVQAAVNRAGNWMGSSVRVSPFYSGGRNDYSSESMPIEAIKFASVDLYRGSPGRSDPGFTYFRKREIGDVLDGGDMDFFRGNPGLEADYFALVQELRQPGSTKRSGRPLVLYTARPKSDRQIYDGATKVPHGIFLTTDFDRASGIASDLSGGKGRHIYKVVIDSKYTIKTLDIGRIKDYQAVAPMGTVPVISMERIV